MIMGIVERIIVRFGGYSPATASQSSHEDREPIVKFGLSVLFSATVAAINWGTAGWAFSVNHPDEVRLAIAVLAGLFSFGLVSVLDSSFIYLADISESHWFKKVLYGVLRVSIIFLVSLITSQAVMPVLLGNELAAYALKMAEDSESSRIKTLDGQYKFSDKQLALKSTKEEVDKLEERSRIIPQYIQQRMKSAKQCWDSYTHKKQQLINDGYPSDTARAMMSIKAEVCSKEDKSAKNMLDAYTEDIRSQLVTARQVKTQAMADLQTTKVTITERVDNARAIEEKAFSPTSATVLNSLIETDPGAKKKYWMVTLFLMMLECLPLILKLVAGRTPVGEKIADERKETRNRRTMVAAEEEHHRRITNAILAATQNACTAVLGSAEGRQYFAEVFSSHMMALAPFEAATKVMKEIERHNLDINDYVRRYPKYATVILEAWTLAMKQTSAILQSAAGDL
jgi:hypothetical protein